MSPFPDTPRGRFLQRLGHYSNMAMMLAVTATIPLGFLGSGGTIASVAGVLLLLTMVAAVFLDFRHNVGMCERCVASMPLNAPDRVLQPRTRTMLRIRHAPFRVVAGCAIVVVVASFVPLRGWQARAENGLADVLIAAVWASFYVHRKVEPWCPWCHPRGDGGSEAWEPAGPPGSHLPVPAGDGTA
jgi:hypothetical protein